MEPHAEKKGRLSGKFEDYTHTPSDAVWDRIVAQPADRPLGPMFWAFTWMPKARVWGRISEQLHPVPYLRIAAWSTAAAAAIALLMVVLLSGGTADKPGQGLAFATHSHGFEGWDADRKSVV